MDIFDIKGSAYLHGTNQSHYHSPRVSRHTDRTYADIRLAVFLEGLPLPSLLKISALPPAAFRDKGSVPFFQSCVTA